MSGHILIFNSSNNEIIRNKTTKHNLPITLIESTEILLLNEHKIYVSFSDGILKEYRVKNNGLVNFIRKSVYFTGEVIHQMRNYHSNSFLIVTDRRGNVSQIDLSTGVLLDSLNVEPYLAAKSNVSMSLLFNN